MIHRMGGDLESGGEGRGGQLGGCEWEEGGRVGFGVGFTSVLGVALFEVAETLDEHLAGNVFVVGR